MKALPPPDRLTFLHARRDLKMACSAYAYVRGNTARFYEWLAEAPVARLVPQGPPVWICGDCHLGNLGPLADSKGRVAIQICYLDQAVIGNPAHDLIRLGLGLSLATAARGSDLPSVVTARMIEEMDSGYAFAFIDPDAEAGDVQLEPDAVRTVRRLALGRKWRHLARERLEDVEPTLPLGKHFWPLEKQERAAMEHVVTHPPVSSMILALDRRNDGRQPVMKDAAYWMKGCRSLGLLRYAAIIALKGKEGTLHALVDLKEAIASVAPVASGAVMPEDPAMRVLEAARALSPNLGERIATAHVLDRSIFSRELMPQDLKIEIEQFSHGEALKAARYLAFLVGKAHARQMAAATRRGRSGTLDAPSWLWQAVVTMASRHEAGYLEHCRRYALAA